MTSVDQFVASRESAAILLTRALHTLPPDQFYRFMSIVRTTHSRNKNESLKQARRILMPRYKHILELFLAHIRPL